MDEIPPYVASTWPRISYGLVSTAFAELPDMLLKGDRCAGIVATMQDYLAWRATSPAYCTLRVVETVESRAGGWVTNSRSGCVATALSCVIAPCHTLLSKAHRAHTRPVPLTTRCAGDCVAATLISL